MAVYKYFLSTIILSIIILSIILFGVSCSEPKPEITPAEAEQTMKDFFTALSTADSTLMNQITTDDFTLYEHEEIWNRDSLLSLMSATQGRTWEIQDFEFETRQDVAHVHYFNVSRKPEGRSWLESALLIKRQDRIQIKFMHSTKLYLNN